jgi:hypothetical protein
MEQASRNLLTVATTVAIILLCGGVYLFYFFFRQVNAQLIETIPTDAAFLFQINDNDTFLKTEKKIHSYITPLFELDAYPGCQFFVDQLPGKYNQVVFSGHDNGDNFSILFACKINERAFSELLTKLQIDVRNCLKFESCKIYTHGTHLKRFVFTYHKEIFLASENITLLKRAISQLKNPRNLTTLKSFETLFHISEKNKKQNWLIINNEKYVSHFGSFFNDDTYNILAQYSANMPWAAYQVKFSGLEMQLSGYQSASNIFQDYFNKFENKYLYYSSLAKTDTTVNYESDPVLKYAKSKLPTYNDFEIAIHADKSEYWARYLSEQGLKKFSISQMHLFSFAFYIGDEKGAGIVPTNGWIQF